LPAHPPRFGTITVDGQPGGGDGGCGAGVHGLGWGAQLQL